MMDKRRALLLLVSLVATFVVIRITLHASPNTDFNIASYNIHHLFTGLLLIALCGIPVTLFKGKGLVMDGLVVGFGIGLSLALDEFVYLITTDGSNASYLLPISFWGGVIMIGLACFYMAILYLFNCRKKRDE